MNTSVPPFVSVIVPVFNDQAGIDKCLEALTTQSYAQNRYEIIVVDNNSEPPIYLKSKANFHVQLVRCGTAGSYAARNQGIAASSGEILAFTDADCVPNSEWIKKGVTALLDGGSNCVVGGEVLFAAPKSKRATELYQYVVGFLQKENINERQFTATANLFTYRSQFDKTGLFDTNLLSGGDHEWCQRATEHGAMIKFCEEAVVVTSPRTELSAAIRQARRIAGGRVLLRGSAQGLVSADNLRPIRKPLSAAAWILKQQQLSLPDRLRVLIVASLIKVAYLLEILRLKLGGKPERR
jgi:glycosyltransferase involved in cell wall biosynthesis